jgi:hypothetical protein
VQIDESERERRRKAVAEVLAAGKHFHCTNCQTPNLSATTTAAG